MNLSARSLPALILLGATLLLVLGVCLFVAGVTSYRAESFMTQWAKDSQEPDAVAWRVAADAAAIAVAVHLVVNGDYHNRLGRVNAWRPFQHPAGDTVAAMSRREALQSYRAAVVARPTWPDMHARLAHMKLLLAETDSEFNAALRAAEELGPYSPPVKEELAAIRLVIGESTGLPQ